MKPAQWCNGVGNDTCRRLPFKPVAFESNSYVKPVKLMTVSPAFCVTLHAQVGNRAHVNVQKF
jgi:hypothetical protein